VCCRIVQPARVIPIDADPVQLAPDDHLLLADDGNVVLGLAGNRACVTPRARAQIDRHAPSVAFILAWRVHRKRWGCLLTHLLHKIWIVTIFLQRSSTNRIAPFHAVMMLRASERIAASSLVQLHSRPEPKGTCSSKRIGVDPRSLTHTPRTEPAVAEVESDGVVRLPWQNPDRDLQFAALLSKFHPFLLVQARPFSHLRA